MKCAVPKCLDHALPELVVCQKHEDDTRDGVRLIQDGLCPYCAAEGVNTPIRHRSSPGLGYLFWCEVHGMSGFRDDNARGLLTPKQLERFEKAS